MQLSECEKMLKNVPLTNFEIIKMGYHGAYIEGLSRRNAFWRGWAVNSESRFDGLEI